MATVRITNPQATANLTLAATVSRIEVSPAVRGLIAALRVFTATDARFRIAADGMALKDGETAPTGSDWNLIPAGQGWPIPVSQDVTQTTPYVIEVWATAGTPVLSITPWPMGR